MDAQRSISFPNLALIGCVAVALLAGVAPISAQVANPSGDLDEPISALEAPPAADLDEARLTLLAQTHLEIVGVQAELQEGLAGNYEEQSRHLIQETARQKIEEIFVQRGLSEQEYGELLFLVGTDQSLWERFDKLLTDLEVPQP